MNERVYGILNENSAFGRLMSRCWLIIATNLLFLLFSIPVVTIGPAWTAMYYVLLKSMRSDDPIRPLRDFWKGFKTNFKQSLITWLIFLGVAAIILIDINFCKAHGGVMNAFLYANYALGAVVLIIMFMMFPVTAAFADSIKGLIRNSVYFAAKNPVRTILILILNIAPIVLTYMDLQRLPLYAFLWCMFGFALFAYLVSKLLIKDFSKILDAGKEEIEENTEYGEEDFD